MSHASLRIPLPDKVSITPAQRPKQAAEGWKTIRIRKQLYDVLIMLQAAKVLQGNARPSMTDIVAEITTIAAPSMFMTDDEDPDALEEADV